MTHGVLSSWGPEVGICEQNTGFFMVSGCKDSGIKGTMNDLGDSFWVGVMEAGAQVASPAVPE